jgi:hypothetical protein
MRALTTSEWEILANVAAASPVLGDVLHEIDDREDVVLRDLMRCGRVTVEEQVDRDGEVWDVYTATAAGRLALRVSCAMEVPLQ